MLGLADASLPASVGSGLLGKGLLGLMNLASGKPSTESMPACLNRVRNSSQRDGCTHIAVNEWLGTLPCTKIS